MSQQADQNRQPTRISRRKKALLTVYEIAVFGMLGALMMVSDLLMCILQMKQAERMMTKIYFMRILQLARQCEHILKNIIRLKLI